MGEGLTLAIGLVGTGYLANQRFQMNSDQAKVAKVAPTRVRGTISALAGQI